MMCVKRLQQPSFHLCYGSSLVSFKHILQRKQCLCSFLASNVPLISPILTKVVSGEEYPLRSFSLYNFPDCPLTHIWWVPMLSRTFPRQTHSVRVVFFSYEQAQIQVNTKFHMFNKHRNKAACITYSIALTWLKHKSVSLRVTNW
jgi:hypothetical protein